MRNSNNVDMTAGAQKIYKVALPYPTIKVEKPNAEYGEYMLEDAAGMVSEMSDVAAYLYQGLMIDPKYQDVIDTMQGIKLVEMNHLEIFQKLAKQLGADPRLWDQKGNRRRYWTPGYIQYPVQLQDMLRYDIEREQTAMNQYAKQMRVITDRNIVAILQRIILDEQLHVEILTELYDKYFRPMPRK